MKHVHRRWLRRCVFLALATTACADTSDPIAPGMSGDVAFAPGGNRPAASGIKIRRLMLDGDLFDLDGTPKAFSFEVDNPGSDLSGVRVEVVIVQDAASRQAAAFPANCAGATEGGLPQGICTMAGTASASNDAPGTGTLVQGNAQFIVTLYQDAAGSSTALASRKTGIGLAGDTDPGSPGIDDVVFDRTELVLDGQNVAYVATLSNPTGLDIEQAFLQGILVQDGNEFGAGGVNVFCPPNNADAVLTTGTCVLVWSARARIQPDLQPQLVPGPAEFVLILYAGFQAPTELDRFTVPVTILSGDPEITNFDFPTTTLVINSEDRVDYSFTLHNAAAERITEIRYQTQIVQGASSAPAGGAFIGCVPIEPGSIDPGTCIVQFTAGASTALASLSAGDAEFVLELYRTSDIGERLIGAFTVPVTLVSQE